jgi:hypothetical protein
MSESGIDTVNGRAGAEVGGVVFAIADSDLSNGTLGVREATITNLLMLEFPRRAQSLSWTTSSDPQRLGQPPATVPACSSSSATTAPGEPRQIRAARAEEGSGCAVSPETA